MKWIIYFLIITLIALVIYNFTQINYTSPFEGESIVAISTVLCGLCGILILAILLTSKKITETLRKRQ